MNWSWPPLELLMWGTGHVHSLAGTLLRQGLGSSRVLGQVKPLISSGYMPRGCPIHLSTQPSPAQGYSQGTAHRVWSHKADMKSSHPVRYSWILTHPLGTVRTPKASGL